jgi:predicted phage terminase large subunit-like protein
MMSNQIVMSDREYQAMLKLDFPSFVERTSYELNPEAVFRHGLYIELVASALQKCLDGGVKRLIINLPPRGLKSHMVSVALVAFALGHDPTKKFICASYGQDLADKHARDCRTIMMSPMYRCLFPQTVISVKSLSDFMTTRGGYRMSTSVNGVLTGRGADIIILDDIIKPDDAISEAPRRGAIEWYRNSLLSRLNDKENGVIIIVMQRLHQEDLVGELLSSEPDRWEVLSLPAIAREDENYSFDTVFGQQIFRRRIGEPLHPERESLPVLGQIKQAIGEFNFQSQYQQDPIPLEGNLVKAEWLCSYSPEERPKKFSFVLQSWDTASKSGELNDYSVCTTWGVYNSFLYLLDVWRKRVGYPELKQAALDLFRKHHPHKILIEDKSSGTSLIQDLRSDGVLRTEAHKLQTGVDKVVRFSTQTIHFEQRKVIIPEKSPWRDEWVREIIGFPSTKFDDQVDSTTQALDYLSGKGKSLAVWSRI